MALVGMVLCAGLGTRLRPLTGLLPKPAVPLCQVPLLRHALGLLAGAGIRRAVVNVHHLPEAMEAVAGAAAAELGLALRISREPVLAGTGGALRQARPLLRGAEAVVVLNGDVLFDVDLSAALSAHRATGALATMALLPMPPGSGYPSVEIDAGGRVRRIAGRFGPGGDQLTAWHFPGLHVVSPELLERVPAEPFQVDVNRDVYPPLLARGLVRGLVTHGTWRDLGTPASYLAANLEVAAGRIGLGRFGLPPPQRIAASARIHPSARVGDDAVVGERCVVPAGARVERAVLWPDTHLREGEVVVDAVAAGDLRVAAGGAAGPPSAGRRT
jgi:mannose-1-phosphate guanylyltransferase